MDPLTHGLTGALIAEAGFQQRLGKHSRLVLSVAAMFPDIDILYRFNGITTYIENHRGLTHSFVGLIVSGILLGSIVGRLDQLRRYVAWIAAIWVALFSHQILDLVTSYGTVVLYPFNRTRFYFDWVFIIDVFLSGIILVALVLSRVKPEKAERRSRIGLISAGCYIAFCAMNHAVAVHQLRTSMNENRIPYRSLAAIPQPGLPFLWSGIVDADSHYYQIPFYNFRKPQPPFGIYNKTTGSIYEQKARNSEIGVLYYWFARYPVVEEYVQNKTHVIEFSDLRFYFRVRNLPVRRPFVLRIKMDESGNILESRLSRS